MIHIRHDMSSGLRPRSTADCGSPHRGRVTCARAFLGPRPSGSLRLHKFDPVEFVLARAKTILLGAKLGARSAPAGPAPGMARAKVTKETRPRMSRLTCASRLWPPSLRHATSLSRAQDANLLVRVPSGLPAKGWRCSGAPYGVLKTPPRRGLSWVAQIPVGASRAPSQAGSFRETPDRARGALFSARRVRRAPGRSEARRARRKQTTVRWTVVPPSGCARDGAPWFRAKQDCEAKKPREVCAAMRPGGLLFGFFLLAGQEKETRPRCGEPQVNTRAKPARQIILPLTLTLSRKGRGDLRMAEPLAISFSNSARSAHDIIYSGLESHG